MKREREPELDEYEESDAQYIPSSPPVPGRHPLRLSTLPMPNPAPQESIPAPRQASRASGPPGSKKLRLDEPLPNFAQLVSGAGDFDLRYLAYDQDIPPLDVEGASDDYQGFPSLEIEGALDNDQDFTPLDVEEESDDEYQGVVEPPIQEDDNLRFGANDEGLAVEDTIEATHRVDPNTLESKSLAVRFEKRVLDVVIAMKEECQDMWKRSGQVKFRDFWNNQEHSQRPMNFPFFCLLLRADPAKIAGYYLAGFNTERKTVFGPDGVTLADLFYRLPLLPDDTKGMAPS